MWTQPSSQWLFARKVQLDGFSNSLCNLYPLITFSCFCSEICHAFDSLYVISPSSKFWRISTTNFQDKQILNAFLLFPRVLHLLSVHLIIWSFQHVVFEYALYNMLLENTPCTMPFRIMSFMINCVLFNIFAITEFSGNNAIKNLTHQN